MNNLIKISLSTFLLSSLAYSQTTMCFKENHTNLSTLESVKLDGGECQSKYSLTEMKASGWRVEDIKISNNNYIYILKKGTPTTSNFTTTNIDEAELERRVLAKMEKKKEIEEKKKEEIRQKNSAQNGANIYVNKCQVCHGEKGLEKPGMSNEIGTLSKSDFKGSIQGYRNGSYNLGTAVQMSSYAYAMSEEDIEDVYYYLQSIK